ncbi:transcription factor A, mitochondrial-like [Cloeon dipterum]|uniref:transcription factor A, mitochondrial-like n=1 Tax=Cloeon dipterum TaxID=197152 RepID=UPI00321F7272
MQGLTQKFGTLMACQRTFLAGRSVNLQQSAGLKRWVEEKHGIPARPKKPQTPYLKYINQLRPNLVKANPNLKFTEITKLAGAEWQKLSATQRKPFEANFSNEWAAYLQAVENYKSSLTEEQKALIEDVKEQEKKKLAKKEIRMQERENGKPKRYLTAFMLYSQEASANRGNIPRIDFQVKLGEQWRKLDAATKDKYQKRSDELRVEYLASLKKWEDKMIRLGNLTLVRNDVLADNQAKAVASLKKKSVKHMMAKVMATKATKK